MVKITRSFSSRIQLKQFEPVESFCSIEQECDEKDIEAVSGSLDSLCRAEVLKTINSVQMAQVPQGKSKYEKKDISKDEAERDISDFG